MLGEKQNIGFMKSYVFAAYPYIEKQLRNKTDRKAIKGNFKGRSIDVQSLYIGIENEQVRLKVPKTGCNDSLKISIILELMSR